MLRNRKLIYLLLPLNIAIWTYFIFRFSDAFNTADFNSQKAITPEVEIARNTDSLAYELSLNYQDPFLKYVVHRNRNRPQNLRQEHSGKRKSGDKPPAIAQPQIKFLGIIKNNSKGNTTALITLNGQSRLIRKNDEINGVKFNTITTTSLIAQIGKEKIVVPRELSN